MDKQILESLVNQNFSTYKIAETLNVSQTTVRYWMKKYQLSSSYFRDTGVHTTCLKCDSLGPFYTKGNRNTSYCKSCFNKYCMERWKAKKLKAIEYKGSKCVDCNQSFHYSVYEFHHLDPLSKDYDWSKLRMKSWKSICNELDKCVLICSNCHRLRHWKEA